MAMLSFLSHSLFAQASYTMSKWRYSDPKPLGFTVLDVKFYDNNFGIAVGAGGVIARTKDGGTKWDYGTFTYTPAGGLTTTGNFADISVPTATVAYTVGSNGMMAKTTDAGQNWTFVSNPLYANARNINTCWFFNKDTGYIAGQWNTADSLPKLYYTKNGGATWDSLAAPTPNGTTRVGFVQNSTYPPIDLPITAKAKEIFRIQFLNQNIGYIVGSGSPLFPGLGIPNVTSTTTCAATTSQLTTGSHNASLVWKFENGTLTDYSMSKERLGYTGYPALPPFNCTSKFGTVSQTVQQYRAFTIINDSSILLLSFNNNVVVKIKTGKNDSTLNVNRPGIYEKGKYEVLNTGPAGVPAGYNPIPPTAQQTLFSSNPYRLRRASNGKLYAAAGNGRLWTSIDTGRTWVQENSLPQGRNYSTFATWAFDFLPSGKLITMGQGGVIADSIPGGSFQSNYVYNASNGSKIDFVDCNNGMVVGSSSITVTTDGGNSWINKNRADFAASFYSINGFSYPKLNKAYFAVSNGVVYSSIDQATTLDPAFSNFNYGMNDVVGIGNDTVYAVGYNTFSIAAASRKTMLFRSYNNGVTWDSVVIIPPSGTTTAAANASNMAFPSRNVGYVCGTRNSVYKTTNGGTTWTDISPFPSLNAGPTGYPSAFVSYTDICALDENTVFLVGNMFTNTGIKRVYKTTDGGATWTDITGNMPALLPVGNMLSILFHDTNNGYVAGSNVMFVTTNGGASWSMEVSPHSNLNNALGFAPRAVPTSVAFANRKVFVAGIGVASGIPTIMEYGDTLNVRVNTTEVVANATCSNLTAGSITITASGGLAPYSYSINGGAFQSSNTFTGLTQGAKTITVKDFYCGTVTKTVNVGFTDNLTLTTTPAIDTTVCANAPVPLIATATTGASYSWTPITGLSSATVSNPTASVGSNTSYTVTATLNGCVRNKTIPIKIKPNPIVSAGPAKTIIIGDEATLEGSGAAGSIIWTPAASIISGSTTYNPIVRPSTTTTYTLSVTDANSCNSKDNVLVTVLPYCVKPMGAFTPNNDGINDKWMATTSNICTNRVRVIVYNRYGSTVYSNDNYQNEWDGTYKGSVIPDGTYYYYAVYELINGKTISLSGDVTIIR